MGIGVLQSATNVIWQSSHRYQMQTKQHAKDEILSRTANPRCNADN